MVFTSSTRAQRQRRAGFRIYQLFDFPSEIWVLSRSSRVPFLILNVQGRCVDIFFWRSSLDCEFFYLRFFFVNRRSRDSEVPHSIRKMSESHVVVSWNSHLRTFTSRKNYDLTVGKEGSTVTAQNPKMPAGIRENAHGGQSLKKPRFYFAGKNERIRLPREKPKQKMRRRELCK